MRKRWAFMAIVGAGGLALTGCTSSEAVADTPPAAVVEQGAGSAEPVITLTEDGAARIGVQTTAVVAQSPLTVPYSALLYEPSGDTWVYTSPRPLTYFRQPVVGDVIDGDLVILTDGPAPGTEVVTVGVAELWGAENGIGQ